MGRAAPASTLLILVPLGIGCGQHPPQQSEMPTRAVSSEPVLATVNGVPVLASDLALQMRDGVSAEEALQELIRLELLAQEAQRRGLHRGRTVSDAQRRAMVQLLVRREFRDRLGPAQIPRPLVQKAYQLNLKRYVRPELAEVSHLLVKARQGDSPERHQAARRLAERARALAVARPLTPEQFVALEKTVAAEAGAIPVRVETLTTPLRGYTVAPFADAAFALRRPGEVSPVVETRFGYHVIYLRQRTAAVNVALEQAEPEIRRNILQEVRTQLLNELIGGLEKQLGARLMPENLDKPREVRQ